MKLWLLLAVAPWVLAPVYYQGGSPAMLEPVAGRVSGSGVRELPAAAPLVSPLLVTPTGGPVTEKVSATEEGAAGVKKAPADKKVALLDRQKCIQGMETLQDLASLAYQRSNGAGGGNYMGVIVAAALAKQQAAEGDIPSVAVVKKRIEAIGYGRILRNELRQGYVLVEAACLPVGIKQFTR